MRDAIRHLAKRSKIPRSAVASQLINEALELIEDEYWVKIAMRRDKKGAKYISHKEAWKHLSK